MPDRPRKATPRPPNPLPTDVPEPNPDLRPVPTAKQKSKKPTRKVIAQYLASVVVMLVVYLATTYLGLDITADDLAGLKMIVVAVLSLIVPGVPAIFTYFINPHARDGVEATP